MRYMPLITIQQFLYIPYHFIPLQGLEKQYPQTATFYEFKILF